MSVLSFNNYTSCYGCTHFDLYNKRCRIGSDCEDCDDFEIDDHFEDKGE